MSRGYPDFFGFPVFPDYGETTTKAAAALAIVAGTSSTLLDLTFKGRIIGGRIYTSEGALHANQYFELTIDGVSIGQYNGETEYAVLGEAEISPVIHPVRIDDENFYYDWRFKKDTVVNYQFKLVATNAEAVVLYGVGISLFYNGYTR
jgi:hypothetical protein